MQGLRNLRNQWPLAIVVATLGTLWFCNERGDTKEQPPQIACGFEVRVNQEAEIRELLKSCHHSNPVTTQILIMASMTISFRQLADSQ